LVWKIFHLCNNRVNRTLVWARSTRLGEFSLILDCWHKVIVYFG
jgi:hypothetical protein